MHIITGEIRKEPFTKEGPNGKLYIVELSERFKDREGSAQYTNYKFFFNAKNDALRGWYDEAFQAGKVVSISCDTLRVESNEHNGKVYLTLSPGGFANLNFSQRSGAQQSGGGNQQRGWGQPQQPQQNHQPQQNQPPKQNNQPPMDFDDDIPF